MKKIEKRAVLCLILTGFLFFGLCVISVRFVRNGHKWAMFTANSHIYSDGYLKVGEIYDRNGVSLVKNGAGKGGKPLYNQDRAIRISTVHAVGDASGFVSTGAASAFSDKLVGYNLLTGTYSLTGSGGSVNLSIDAELNKTAYQALNGRDGTVAVYNYRTGEVICMVSSPAFDPANPPSPDNAEDGTYLNKFISGRLTPGSIFKLVTSAAAIETLDDISDFHYNCTGSRKVSGRNIKCMERHGTVDFQGALAKSCNGAFSVLAERVGGDNLKEYAEKAGLTRVYNMDGIKNAAGSFEFPDNDDISLGWAGIGQWKDYVNPCSMLVFVSGIANGGKGTVPTFLKSSSENGKKTRSMMKADTASRLQSMMKYNVEEEYGESNFPGLDIYAKSGTAEVNGKKSTAWFTGFIKNSGCPYAFIVCVENGGVGAQVAGPVANRVLQKAVNAG